MTDPVSPADSYTMSQDILHGHLDDTKIVNTLIPMENEAVTASTEHIQLPDEIVDVAGSVAGPVYNTNEDMFETQDTQQTNDGTQQGRRNRFAYRNRWLLADYRLFLNTQYMSDWQIHAGRQWKDIKIRGQIVQCAQKSNNNMYRVKWKEDDISSFDEEWIREYIPSSAKHIIRDAAIMYDKQDGINKNNNTQDTTPCIHLRVRTTRDSRGVDCANKETVADSPDTRVRNAVRTPLSAERYQRAANVLTCGTVFNGKQSTISTLTDPSFGQAGSESTSIQSLQRRITRRQADTISNVGNGQEESDSESEGEEAPPPEEEDSDIQDDKLEEEEEMSSINNANDASSRANQLGAMATLYETINDLSWKYECVEIKQGSQPLDNREQWYSGPDGLKRGVSRLFADPFDCFQMVSGLSHENVARLAHNSNQYFHETIKPRLNDRNNRYHGIAWKDIKAGEMYRFLGILLKMSLQPLDGGGYAAYFTKTNCTPVGNTWNKSCHCAVYDFITISPNTRCFPSREQASSCWW